MQIPHCSSEVSSLGRLAVEGGACPAVDSEEAGRPFASITVACQLIKNHSRNGLECIFKYKKTSY